MTADTKGRVVRIHLASGNAQGIRHAELLNWTGRALVVPREETGELANSWEEESARAGIYVLFGTNEDGLDIAYIGESENVQKRLAQHERNNKDWWTTAVCFTSTDENLTKAHAKYLERTIYERAASAGRYEINNVQTPQEAKLPRADRDVMEEFVANIELLLTTVGFDLLVPLEDEYVDDDADDTDSPSDTDAQPPSPTDIYYHASRGAELTGRFGKGAFLVLKGSILPQDTTASLPPGYKKKRSSLLEQDGRVEPLEDGSYRLLKNYEASSPTAAIGICSGAYRHGPTSWKTKDGRTLETVQLEAQESDFEE